MATNINVGSAYLTIIPSAEGFVRALKKQLAGEGFDKYGALIAKEMQRGFNRSQVVNKIKRSFISMFKDVSKLGRSGMLDLFVAIGIAGISALAPLAGLLIGLPAVAIAAAGALGAVLLALNGVGAVLQASLLGDMEAFEEGLKELTPSAGKVVRELGKIMQGANDLAQEALFAPMVKDAEGLAEVLKGPVQSGLKLIAGSIGTVSAGILSWAKSSAGASVIASVAEQSALFIERAGAGLPALLQGLLDLATVIAGDLGTSIGKTFTRFGEWLSAIANDGRAQQWFDDAIATAKDLLAVVVNLGRFLSAVFKAAGADGGTLAVLIQASEKMADWAESSKGQEILNAIFQFFGTILGEVARAIGTVITAFGELAAWFNNLSPETQKQIAQFIAWAIVLGPFIGRITAIIGLIRTFAGLVNLLVLGLYRGFAATVMFTRGIIGGSAALTAKSGAAAKAGAAVNGFIATLGRGIVAVGRWALAVAIATGRVIASFARMAAAVAVSAAKGALAYARSAAVVAAAGLRMAGAAMLSAIRVAAAWVLMAAKATASAAKQALAFIVSKTGWITTAAIAMVNALRIAASWFIAMGPVGWIILALIAIVAAVIIFWDEIKAAFVAAGQWIWGYIEPYWNQLASFFQTVWAWIKDALNWDELVALITGFTTTVTDIWNGFWSIIADYLSAIWDLIVGIVTGNTDKARDAIGRLAEIPGRFVEWFSGAYNSVKEWLGKALDYIKGVPDSILDKLGDLGSLLWDAGKDLIQGLIDGIKASFGTVQDLLGDLTASLPDWKGPESLDKVILVANGEMVVGSFVKGIKNAIPAVRSALASLTAEIPVNVGSNLDGIAPADPGSRGITIENYNVQAADNRYDADQLWAQAKMVY